MPHESCPRSRPSSIRRLDMVDDILMRPLLILDLLNDLPRLRHDALVLPMFFHLPSEKWLNLLLLPAEHLCNELRPI